MAAQAAGEAADRADLRAKLAVASGGVEFTTNQDYLREEKGDRPLVLSGLRIIFVIADEVHGSQYDFFDGITQHMRDSMLHASFVCFTGTPIEKSDICTHSVFRVCISVYDIQRTFFDGATVPIYYEGRLMKLKLKQTERPKFVPELVEDTESELGRAKGCLRAGGRGSM